jgi:hypothetical protein
MTRDLHCSFCGKSEHRVDKLVAGPGVYICDACIGVASRIIGEDGGWRRRARRAARRLLDRLRRGPAGTGSTLGRQARPA